jgi:hypothetical protein
MRLLQLLFAGVAMLVVGLPSWTQASDDPKFSASQTLMRYAYPDAVALDKGEQAWMLMMGFALVSIGPGSGVTEDQYQKSHALLVSKFREWAQKRREILAPRFAEKFSAKELERLTQFLSAPFYQKYQNNLPEIDHTFFDRMAHRQPDPVIDRSDPHVRAAETFLQKRAFVQQQAAMGGQVSVGQLPDTEMISLYATNFSEAELVDLTQLFSSPEFLSFAVKQHEIENEPETNKLLNQPLLEAIRDFGKLDK